MAGMLLLGSALAGPTGRSTLVGFDNGNSTFSFINYMKSWVGPISPPAFSSGALNSNGFPEGTLSANMGGLVPLPANTQGQTCFFRWTGTLGQIEFQFGALVTVGGGFVQGGGAGGNSATFFGGTNGYVEFTVTQSPYPSSLNIFFVSGVASTGLVSMDFGLLANKAAIDAGKVLNPDLINVVKSLNPATIRTMTWANNAGQDVLTNPKFSYQTPVTAISYVQTRYIAEANAGVIGNTGSAYSCGSYPDMPVTWTDKEVFQGTVTNPNTVLTVTGAANNGSGLIRLQMASTASLSTNQLVSFNGYNYNGVGGDGLGAWKITVIDATHIDLATSYPSGVPSVFATTFSTNGSLSTATINVGSRGAKLLSGAGGIPFVSGTLASGVGTFVYDATLDQALYKAGGLDCYVPLAVHIAACNELNMNLWYNIPTMIDDASVTSMVQLVTANLNSNLSWYPEYSNETWNPNFVQFFYCWQMAVANSLPDNVSGSVQQNYSFSGLRTRQIMANVTSTWLAAGKPQSRLKRVMACQAFGNTGLFNTYKFKGNDLAAFGGGSPYNVAPNRPIDYCDTISFAPYAQGAQFNTVYSADASGASDYANMTAAADLYATGTAPNIATALAMVDTDFRSTTVDPSVPPSNGNLFFYGNTTGNGGNGVYYGWESVRAGYDGARPAGLPSLTCDPYEGSI